MAFKTYGEPNIERTLAAFQGERTDRVPLFETLIEDNNEKRRCSLLDCSFLLFGPKIN